MLFRSFVFQRLVAGTGVWIAQISLGLLFATGHWDNPGMHGATLAWATVELFLGAVLLGLAYSPGLELGTRVFAGFRRQRLRVGRLVPPSAVAPARVGKRRPFRARGEHLCGDSRFGVDFAVVEVEGIGAEGGC